MSRRWPLCTGCGVREQGRSLTAARPIGFALKCAQSQGAYQKGVVDRCGALHVDHPSLLRRPSATESKLNMCRQRVRPVLAGRWDWTRLEQRPISPTSSPVSWTSRPTSVTWTVAQLVRRQYHVFLCRHTTSWLSCCGRVADVSTCQVFREKCYKHRELMRQRSTLEDISGKMLTASEVLILLVVMTRRR